MFLLDTNVVSELMRQDSNLGVIEWLDRQLATDVFTTAITVAEIRTGVAFLPDGRRKTRLSAAAERAFAEYLSGRVLPFDVDAASEFAVIAALRRSAGHPIGQLDCQIAAIARSRGASVVTRNTSDFEGCEVSVIDPWETT